MKMATGMERLIAKAVFTFGLFTLISYTAAQNVARSSLPSSSPVSSSSEMHGAAQCFHVKGVPTLQLKCPGGELIKTQNAFFGAPKNESKCRYDAAEKHCIQLTDLQENCNGRYMCSVYVSNPFLMNCRTYATYMQVNYTCIPKTEVLDICKTQTLTTKQGYIRTPNYPDANYTANLHCGCRMHTQDSNILLKVLDFSVNHTRAGVCNTDYMRIANWGKKCGHIGASRLPERLEIDRQDLTVEFHTDDSFQARGFWLQFQGSYRGDVKITCGPIQHTSNGGRGEGSRGGPPQPGSRPRPSGREDDAEGDNLILIDDTDEYPREPRDRRPAGASGPNSVDSSSSSRDGNSQRPPFPSSRDRPDQSRREPPQEPRPPPRRGWERDPREDGNRVENRVNNIPRGGDNSGYPPQPPNYRPGGTEEDVGWREGNEVSGGRGDEKDPAAEDEEKKLTKEVDSETEENEVTKDDFDTYELSETQGNYGPYGVDTVQIITGCVVGVLILIAVIIIVVLVFRR